MTNRHTHSLMAGAALWILNVQYFIVQIVVARAWSRSSYSWANNTISDLANTHCGSYGSRFVCSPLHGMMNASFIVVGITIIGGVILLQRELAVNFMNRLGMGCMGCAGLGAILIGLYPENSIGWLHTSGATLSFLLGNLGMVLLGISFNWLPRLFRIYTILSGLVGSTALLLFLKSSYVGLDIGGMERIVAYPQTVWMIAFGFYVLVNHSNLRRDLKP